MLTTGSVSRERACLVSAWLILIFICKHKTAERKNRNAKRWVVTSFIFLCWPLSGAWLLSIQQNRVFTNFLHFFTQLHWTLISVRTENSIQPFLLLIISWTDNGFESLGTLNLNCTLFHRKLRKNNHAIHLIYDTWNQQCTSLSTAD